MSFINDLKNNKLNNISIEANVFNINTPINEQLLVVRNEMQIIGTEIIQFLRSQVWRNIVLYGPKGSGKTAIISYLIKDAAKSFKEEMPTTKIQTLYVNCNATRTAYRTLKFLSGTSKNLDSAELWNSLQNKCHSTEDKPIKTFIIFDEIDLLQTPDDILYNLTRDEKYKDVFLIFITNKTGFYNKLSPDVQSSIMTEYVPFQKYDADEIFEILKRRAAIGLQTFDDEIIRLIAFNNHDYFKSDVRIGIRVLGKLLVNVEEDDSDDAEKKAFNNALKKKEINRYMTEESVKQKNSEIELLGDEQLLLLLAIIKCAMNTKSEDEHEYTAHSVDVIRLFAELASKKGFGYSKPIYLKHLEVLITEQHILKTKTRINSKNLNTYTLLLGFDNMEYVEYLSIYERKVVAIPRSYQTIGIPISYQDFHTKKEWVVN